MDQRNVLGASLGCTEELQLSLYIPYHYPLLETSLNQDTTDILCPVKIQPIRLAQDSASLILLSKSAFLSPNCYTW